MSFRARLLHTVPFALALAALLLASCDAFYPSDDLTVARYFGPEITPETAENGWSAEVDRFTVTLRGRVLPNNEVFFVTLSDRGEALPALHEIWAGRPEGAGRVVRKARLEIQDWTPGELVSGVLDASLPTGTKTRHQFYVQLAERE